MPRWAALEAMCMEWLGDERGRKKKGGSGGEDRRKCVQPDRKRARGGSPSVDRFNAETQRPAEVAEERARTKGAREREPTTKDQERVTSSASADVCPPAVARPRHARSAPSAFLRVSAVTRALVRGPPHRVAVPVRRRRDVEPGRALRLVPPQGRPRGLSPGRGPRGGAPAVGLRQGRDLAHPGGRRRRARAAASVDRFNAEAQRSAEIAKEIQKRMAQERELTKTPSLHRFNAEARRSAEIAKEKARTDGAGTREPRTKNQERKASSASADVCPLTVARPRRARSASSAFLRASAVTQTRPCSRPVPCSCSSSSRRTMPPGPRRICVRRANVVRPSRRPGRTSPACTPRCDPRWPTPRRSGATRGTGGRARFVPCSCG